MIDRGAHINAEAADDGGRTALQAACKNGCVGIVKTLLEAGAVTNLDTLMSVKTRETPLVIACREGHAYIVDLLITYGAKVNPKRDFPETTPLITAIEAKHAHVVDVLIRAGADVNHEVVGMTALDIAHRNRLDDIAKALLDAGAKY